MIRNIIEDEEFKRRQKIREDRAERKAKEETQRLAELERVKQQSRDIEDMTYEELANQKPSDAIDASQNRDSRKMKLSQQNLSAMNDA